MIEIDTLFQTKTATKNIAFGAAYTYNYSLYKGKPPPPPPPPTPDFVFTSERPYYSLIIQVSNARAQPTYI